MAKTRRGTSKRGGRWQGSRDQAALNHKIERHAQTRRGLLAGDRGEVVVITSTLSRLSYKHPRAYAKFNLEPIPDVPIHF